MRRHLLALLLLSVTTFFVGLGRPAISDADEGYYAEAAREMVESGDWLTPYFDYEQRWQKPVLYYWTTAAVYRLTGPSEWAARCTAAVSGLGLVLITWVAGRRLFGRDDVAWLAGLMVATSVGYFAMARQALPDLPVTFCISLAIVALMDSRWLLAGVAVGLGLLTKGPIAALVPALVLVPIWTLERRWRSLPLGSCAAAVGVAVAVAIPWYAAMTMVHGLAYLQSFFVGDNLERFATDRFNEPRPIWFYLPIVAGGILPWTAYLLLLPWKRWAEQVRSMGRLEFSDSRLLIWVLAPLLFYTASIGKQPRYILPVLPPLALLMAQALASRVAGPERRGLAAATWTTAALFALLAGLVWRARPMFLTAVPWFTTVGAGLLTLAAVTIAGVALLKAWHRLPLVLTASAVALLLTLQFGVLSGLRPEAVEQMAALVAAQRTAVEPVGTYRVMQRNLVFYTGFRTEDLFDEQRAVEFLRSPRRALLVVSARDIDRLEVASASRLVRLGQVRYLDAANVRLRTLLWPDPTHDLDTVLLVANR